jgi:predicted ATP-grasp superfamily ATP-dependent carboligase
MDEERRRTSVLLTDADDRSTLAAARALVAAGHRVHVVGPRRWSLAGVARGVHGERVVVDPCQDGAAYVAGLVELIRRRRIEVLIPTTDAAMAAVLAHRSTLPPALLLPVPSADAYQTASDKRAILAEAAAVGLAVPESIVVQSPDQEVSWQKLSFPAVVKPHRSVIGGADGTSRQKCGVAFIADAHEGEAVLAALPAEAFPVLLQRRVRGPGEGVFMLRWDGRIVARFAHRRLREKPPAGGVSVYREGIPIAPDLEAAVERLLARLGWQGVVMVECKRDSASGRAVLMEINGRFWGSLQLAIDAGVDFPRLLVACALEGATPRPPPSYRSGLRSRWFWGDVDHLVTRLRHHPRTLALDSDAPTRLQVLREFLRWRRGCDRWEVLRADDPAPFLLETLQRLGFRR